MDKERANKEPKLLSILYEPKRSFNESVQRNIKINGSGSKLHGFGGCYKVQRTNNRNIQTTSVPELSQAWRNFVRSVRFFPGSEGEVGRHRRRQQRMQQMVILVMLVAFCTFFIPKGFQFLAVLGGKAFLMAELALLVASLNGIKKIFSGVHYGLYHPPAPVPGPSIYG